MPKKGGTAVRRAEVHLKHRWSFGGFTAGGSRTTAPGSETLSSNWKCLQQDVCAAHADVSALILSYLTIPSPADRRYPGPKPPLISEAEFRAV